MATDLKEAKYMMDRVLYSTDTPEAALAIARVLERHGYSILTDEGVMALYEEQRTIFNDDLNG